MKIPVSALLLCLPIIAAMPARADTLPAACGDDAVKFRITIQDNPPAPSAPGPGKAQIAILGSLDYGVTTRIGLDGAWIGVAKGSTYFTYDVAPGEHHLCANWVSYFDLSSTKVWLLPVNAEAGHIYYFYVNSFLTRSVRHFDLAPLNQDEGSYLVKTLSRSSATPKK